MRGFASLFVLWTTSLLTFGCGFGQALSRPETNLGGGGNDRVVAMYSAYASGRNEGRIPGCNGSGKGGRRVLIQGFGPFQSSSSNISGQVVQSMSRPAYWPSSTVFDLSSSLPSASSSSGNPGAQGGFAVQRSLVYNGARYEICFVVTEVQWDFAAAVVLFEAQKFSPEFVLMTGKGALASTGRLESGALNRAVSLTGYDYRGAKYPGDEVPVSEPVLTGVGVQDEIAMTWNSRHIGEGLAPNLAYLRQLTRTIFDVRIMSNADSANTYICNNMAFVVLHGAQGISIELAGGKLRLEPRFARSFRAGFFHFPLNSGATSEAIWGWSHLLMRIVEREFEGPTSASE